MTSQETRRRIILDDGDPAIKYSGPGWFQEQGQDNVGVQGSPYLHTLHGTSQNGTISLEFNGTQPKAFGSFYQITTPGAHVWRCSMDGIGFGQPPPPSGNISGNNYLLCDGTKLNMMDGTHTLTIDIFITSKRSTFWFDWIEYLPSAAVPLDNTVVRVNHDDPIIQFDASWQPPTGLLTMTTVPGSTATIHFIGESASWYTIYSPVELFLSPATGSYSLDGGESTQFTWQAAEDGNWSNQLLFTTPKATQGPHNLTVIFVGSTGASALALDYLLIHNGSTTLPEPMRHGIGPHGVVPIIVGAVGGFLLLMIIASAYYLLRRYRLRQIHRCGWAEVSFFRGRNGSRFEAQSAASYTERRVEEKLKRLDGRDRIGTLSQSDSSGVVECADVVLRHEDSGTRFPYVIRELPPSYTAA